ncbi:MAG TPA: polyprenol monophosphomannose synthase [Saprospiraceae bacterium]|nr:polyprenol monophosphomannose synthase [Saprospiraceae bacterium]HQW55488.1 polyprenol monophosphomannose synthase [Saprospiraceae bacterium]
MSDSLVIIPTYNESENILLMIDAVFGLEKEFDLLIIDDNSPDGTSDLVRQMQQTYPTRLKLIERPGKKGLGTAYILGFEYGLEHGYEYIFEMDCDFSHNPQDLIRLYNACKKGGFDMSVGSRYVTGGKVENWPRDRIFLSYGASLYVRILTWMPIKDPTAGFVCYKREVLQAINFDKIKFIGYAFQIEMKFAAQSLGFKIKEVPITFKDRVRGSSKITKGIMREGFFGVFKMVTNKIFDTYQRQN